MKICSYLIFGPAVIMEQFNDFEEAICEINNSEYGLQAGIFSNAISEMNLAFQNPEVGAVIINDLPTFRVDHMPYDGIRNSGFSREGIKYAIMEMMEPKLMVGNSL